MNLDDLNAAKEDVQFQLNYINEDTVDEAQRKLEEGEVENAQLEDYIETIVLGLLVEEGGIPAWNGDGVGCVRNLIEALYNKAYNQK